MLKRFVAVILCMVLSTAALRGWTAEEASIEWVSYCRGKLSQARIVTPEKARSLSAGKQPFCVSYAEGAYDPGGLSGACDEYAEKPRPWTSTKRVDLLMTAPAGAEVKDYEVVVTVTADEAPLGCASCDPRPECEKAVREVTKEFRLAFSKQGERKRWNVIEAMVPGEGKEFLSMKATAVLKRKGSELRQRPVRITWAFCC